MPRDLEKTDLELYIDNCTLCGKELQPIMQIFGLPPKRVYCPKDDITKSRWSSFPYLCSNCHSDIHFYPDKRDYWGDVCWFCLGTDFFSQNHDEFKQMVEKGELRIGYYLSQITPASVPKICQDGKSHKFTEKFVKHADEIYKMSCIQCNLDIYFNVCREDQEEFRNKVVIDISDLARTQKTQIVSFSDLQYLKEKLGKVFEEWDNEKFGV